MTTAASFHNKEFGLTVTGHALQMPCVILCLIIFFLGGERRRRSGEGVRGVEGDENEYEEIPFQKMRHPVTRSSYVIIHDVKSHKIMELFKNILEASRVPG